MCTAGTMLPLFQIVRPTLQHVESHDGEAHPARASATIDEEVATPDAAARPKAESHGRNSFDRQMEKKAKLPGWYPQVEQMAAKVGIRLQTEQGGMAGALLLIAVVVVPAIAALRLGMMYLNNYCLSWSGAHAVADLRQEMLEHVQRQGMQFFGRVDVGQIMTRISADPQQIQVILTTILTEVALAPFEILVAVGYIVW